MAKNKAETTETPIGSIVDIAGMRSDLKKLIHDEAAGAKKTQKKRLNALKAKHAAINAEILASGWGTASPPLNFIYTLLLKKLNSKKNTAELAENQSQEAGVALKKLRESKSSLGTRLANAMGIKPPASVSEQDVEKYPVKKKLQVESSLKELNEAESALKELTQARKEKEHEFQNLKESIGRNVNTDYLAELSDILYQKQQDTEKRSIVLVQKKKMLAEHMELEYRNSLLEIIIKKEAELLKPLLLEPEVQGIEKIIPLVKTVFEMLRSSFVEKPVTEIPVYDTSRYGEIISFVPPEHFDIVEQSWISEPCALASILFNKKTRKNLYYISEPILTPFEEALLKNVNESLKVFLLEQKIDFTSMNKELVLYDNFNKILNIYGIEPDEKSRQKIWYHIKRNYVGYVKLDVLIKDPMIEDISVVGSNTPVYLYHRKYANIETNITFEDEELNEMIMKLAQISGKSISTGYPILNARLPDGSRLEATLGREVTTHGGTVTIRKFREEPFTPTDLIKAGTFNTEIMAYLWLEVENNKSIILVGETASGKTTTLNAISLFIPSESKVISIEDTREITLYHNNWIPGVVRESFMGQEAASIDMFELLRSALRQRPEYLIVGEVRGKEAYTLFQAMSTGHTTYSTMHAGSVQLAVNRLLNEPINVPLMMLSALNVMIVQVLRHVGGKRVRRMDTFSEFVGIDAVTGDISIRELYKWNPINDRMEQSGTSKVLEDIMYSRGWSRERLNKELENRKLVLQYMVDNDIHNYRDVSLIIRMYASDPATVLNSIAEGKSLLDEKKWL